MLGEVALDLVDPFLVPSIPLFEVCVVMIEAVVIYFLLERSKLKSLVASFVANLASGILSLFYFFFAILTGSMYLELAVGLIINIVVETAVLKALFFSKVDLRKLFKVSIIMNLCSYALLILYLAYPSLSRVIHP